MKEPRPTRYLPPARGPLLRLLFLLLVPGLTGFGPNSPTEPQSPPLRLESAQGLRDAGRIFVAPVSPGAPRLVLILDALAPVAILWRADTGDVAMRLEGHKATLEDAAFSSDARRLVTIDQAGEIRIWDVMTGTGRVLGRETGGRPLEVRFSTDAHWIISGSRRGRPRVWEAQPQQRGATEGTPLGAGSRDGHEAGVVCWQLSPDGRWLLSGDSAGGGVLWDTGTWQPAHHLPPSSQAAPAAPPQSVSCHGDGRHLVRTWDDRVEVWDLMTGRSVGRLPLGPSRTFMELSPDVQEALVSARDGAVELWSVTRGERLRTVRESRDADSDAFKGDRFFRFERTRVFKRDQETWNFDVQQWHAVRLLSGEPSSSGGIDPTRGDPTLLEGPVWASDGSYAVLRLKSRVEVWRPTGTSGQTPAFAPATLLESAQVVTPRQVSFSPVESNRLLIASEEGMLLWDAASDSPLKKVSPAAGPKLDLDPFYVPSSRMAAAFTPDGRYIVGFPLSFSGSLHLSRTSVETDAVTPIRETDPESIALSGTGGVNGDRLTLVPSPFGRRIVDTTGWHVVAAARGDEPEAEVRLMAARTGTSGSRQAPYQMLRSYPGTLMALSPDGRFFVTQGTLAGDDTTRSALFVHDTRTGAQLGQTAELGTDRATGAVISPDGRFMVTFNDDPYGQGGRNTRLWDLRDPKAPRRLHTFPHPARPAFSKKGDMLVLAREDGTLHLWSLESLLGDANGHAGPVRVFPAPGSPIPGHSGGISHLDLSADGRFLVTVGDDERGDGTIRLWDTGTGLELCKLFSFTDGTWAVVDPSGRYDASNGGENDWLSWVVGSETIGLSQLKSRYYEPGLLARLMGFSQEPLRNVRRFEAPRLYPDVQAEVREPAQAPSLHIALTERGGGIGRTLVSINGKEVLQLRGEHPGPSSSGGPRVESVAPDAAKRTRCERQPGQLTCDIPLEPLFHYFQTHPVRLPGTGMETAPERPVNRISVQAYNDEEYLLSRPVTFEYTPPQSGTRGGREVKPLVTEAQPVVPRLWAVVAGVSDYTGNGIDLRYAAKDADDFARALEASARRLLCSAEEAAAGKTCERVHIRRLSTTAERQDLCLPALTGPASGDGRFTEPEGEGASCSLEPSQNPCTPDKRNLLRALEELEQARPEDIVVIYLAGHGATSRQGNQETYHYLTRDAWSLDMTDPELRCGGTLSSASLNEALKKSPAAKQVMILDTCHSGAMVLKMTGSRGMSSSQVRAMEQMKDQTGMYVLAGAPSDAASYESPEFRQGVLTYSLLEGMSAEGLAEASLVDVGRLFEYASKKVPELARGLRRAQRPVIAMPRGGGNFFLGQVTPPERGTILEHLVRTSLPRFVIPNFFERDTWLDSAGVKAAVVSELQDRSGGRQSTLAFVDAAEMPGAYQLVGSYRTTGGGRTPVTLEVSARLFKDGKRVGCEFRVPEPQAPRGGTGPGARGKGAASAPPPRESKPLAAALVDGALRQLERAHSPTPPACPR